MTEQRKHPEGVYARTITRDGRAVVVWDAVAEAPRIQGRRRKAWKRGLRTQAEAIRWRREQLGRADRGVYVEPSRQTVNQYLNEWLPSIRASVRPSTWRSYSMHVRVHIGPRIGDLRLQGLAVEHVSALYADLLASGLAPASVCRVHATLHRALRDARRSQRLQRNPADDATRPKVESGELTVWSPEEVRRFLDFLSERDPTLHALYALTVTTGLRRGEGLGLRWIDTDFEGGQIRVQQTLLVSGSALTYGQPKTRRGRRAVALDAHTLSILRRHRAQQAERRLACGAAWVETGLVFDRGDGDAIHPDAVSKGFGRLAKAAGLRPIRFHDLRHTSASMMLISGTNPKVVSERLGHATVGFTLDRYCHLLPGLQEEAAERTGALIYGSG